MIEVIRLCGKFGIEIVLVGAGCWVVYFLIKHTVIRLGSVIDGLMAQVSRLADKLERHDMQSNMRGQFTKKEHEALMDSHKKLQDQHDEMIKTLGRINGYKQGG